MNSFWWFLVVLALAAIFGSLSRFQKHKTPKSKYSYKGKKYFLTKSENIFYKLLKDAIGNEYEIFSQVHLPTIVDHKVRNGQGWRGALAHIHKKSVDFVLCDKEYLSPKLVIELDDKSHEREDRIKRDREVERILKDANLPLLRIKGGNMPTSAELKEKIKTIENHEIQAIS